MQRNENHERHEVSTTCVSGWVVRFASILLALLFSAGAMRAQEIPQCGPLLPTTSAGCVAVEHDRFKGTTSATLKFRIATPSQDELLALTFVSITSESPLRLTAVGAVVIRKGIQPVTDRNPSLYVLADSKRFVVPMSLMDADYPDRLMTREVLTGGASLDCLKAFADAKTLEMKFRDYEFTFDDAARRSLQRFVAVYCLLPTAY